MTCLNNLRTYRPYPQGWENQAQITASDIYVRGNALAYFYYDESPALVLARLVIGENERGLPVSMYQREFDYIMWTVRIRAFMGLINYSPATRTVLGISQTFTGSGTAGDTVTIMEDLIFGADAYSPLRDIKTSGDPCQITEDTNMRRAFCPETKEIFDLEDLYIAYIHAQNAPTQPNSKAFDLGEVARAFARVNPADFVGSSAAATDEE